MKRKLLQFSLPFFLIQVLHVTTAAGQITVSGTVYDSSKLYVVPGVNVASTSGTLTTTDSLGAYHINVSENDSLSFFYGGKSTVKFPVRTIGNYTSFDISLRIRVNARYKLLQGITVFADSYHRDSVENRIEYSKIFNLEKPALRSTSTPGEPPGLDIDALVNMFHFRKNKQNLAFQRRLVEDEQDRYVDYRFNSKLIHRITGLGGDTLAKYKKIYRPSYSFIVSCTLTEFYEYLLNTSYAFKKEEGIQ